MRFCETWNWGPGDSLANGVGAGFDTMWAAEMGQYTMLDNELRPVVCNWPNRLIHMGDTDSDDQVLATTIVDMPGHTFVGLALRVVSFLPPGREYYLFTYTNDPSLGFSFTAIAKYKADVFTPLVATIRSFASGDIIKARVTGNLLEMLVNGVTILSTTDTAIPSSKRLGLHMEWQCSTTPPIIDNTFGGDVAEEDDT